VTAVFKIRKNSRILQNS